MAVFLFLAAIFTLVIAQLPDTSSSFNFRIRPDFASYDSPLRAIKGWDLSSYHLSPCYDYAVFTNQTGRIFYANGTAEEFSDRTSTIASDGGSPPWPWGIVVSAANATDSKGRRQVYIDCGAGTPGMSVADWPATVYYQTGTFYVCEETFLYGPAIALYWREKVDQTPEGCANVELQAWCLEDETEHEFSRKSTCYLEGDDSDD